MFEAALAGANRLGARTARETRRGGPRIGQARQYDWFCARPRKRDSGNVLTAREIEVLALVAQGISNQEIGERLFISAFTVKRHIANILTKLDVPSRAAAAAYAIREGLARCTSGPFGPFITPSPNWPVGTTRRLRGESYIPLQKRARSP